MTFLLLLACIILTALGLFYWYDTKTMEHD